MKEYTKEELNDIYIRRRKVLADYLTENNICACVFIDSEEHRDPAVAYFTGHANDAVLLIFSDEISPFFFIEIYFSIEKSLKSISYLKSSLHVRLSYI